MRTAFLASRKTVAGANIVVVSVLVVAFTFSGLLLSQSMEPEAATAKLYKQHCQSCHMAGGKARDKLLNLADGVWKHGRTEKDVIHVIANGVPPTAMRPFKAKLTPKQIEELARYVLSFEKGATPPDVTKD